MPIKHTAYIGLFIYDDCSNADDTDISISETSLPGKRRAKKRKRTAGSAGELTRCVI